ncbi:hypothetical protein ACT9XH_09440 [Methanococcoides methylutens]|uniref:hypothetical protein n=1 Tax=Methanococcoides methylutens TaxID=2226 RepID=UPI0040449D0A
MRPFSRIAGTAIMLCMMLLCMQAGAVSLNLELDTTEYINDLVFYSDGTYDCGNITGYLSVTNPSLNDTVSDINITFSDGITPSGKFIGELKTNSTTIIPYQLSGSGVLALPEVIESADPSTLELDVEQEVTYRINISNPGSENIDILSFEKSFPAELNFMGYTASAGNMNWEGNRSQWDNFTIPAYSSQTLELNFRTTPGSDIILEPSTLSFTTPSIAASRSLSLSAVTTTSFTVEKQMIGKDKWNVGVIVDDASDFDYSLYRVEVYVSDTMLNDPVLIKEYDLDVSLQPGDTWSDSFNYDYSGIPVFFARIYYTIPYTISGNSMPLNPAGASGFVINSVVYDDQETIAGKGKGRGEAVIIGIAASNETGEAFPDEMELQNNDGKDKDNYNLFWILLLVGLTLISKKKFMPLFVGSKKQMVIGSNHLIETIGMDGLGALISNVNSVVMSRDAFNRLSSTGLIDSINKMLDDGDIKVIDTDAEAVGEIMEKYGLTSEDAEVLAAANIASVKKVFITSSELEEAVNDMGLKAVHLSDLKLDHEE